MMAQQVPMVMSGGELIRLASGDTAKIGLLVARVYRNAALNTPNNTWAKLVLDTVSFDPAGMWSATNTRFTPPIAGYYLVTIRARTGASGSIVCGLLVDGSGYSAVGVDGTAYANGGTCIVYCNGSSTYLEPEIFTNNVRAITTGNFDTFMEVVGPLA